VNAEQRAIEDEDWRLYLVTEVKDVSAGAKIDFKPGDIVKACAHLNTDGREAYIHLPSAGALCLEISQHAFERAVAKRLQEILPIGFNKAGEATLFQFLEEMMVSVVFAFTALEAFANEEIPDSYMHTGKSRGLFVARGKATIEREVSLDIKLGEIIPEALKIPTPKGKSVWEDYKLLKSLRDRLVHIKSPDQRALADDPESVWALLCKYDGESFARRAKSIMNYYYIAKGAVPRWFRKIPF